MLLSDSIFSFRTALILIAPKQSQEGSCPDLFSPLPTTPFAFNKENQVTEDEENAAEHSVLRYTLCFSIEIYETREKNSSRFTV